MGEQEALKRQVLTADSVSQDFDGLKKLMVGFHFKRNPFPNTNASDAFSRKLLKTL